MDCHNCIHIDVLETDDVNAPGGKIVRYECSKKHWMNNLKHFPFNNKTRCKEEKSKLQNLNLM